jgi:hypothetical protein
MTIELDSFARAFGWRTEGELLWCFGDFDGCFCHTGGSKGVSVVYGHLQVCPKMLRQSIEKAH